MYTDEVVLFKLLKMHTQPAWVSPGMPAAASSPQGLDEGNTPGPPPCSPRDGPRYL